MSCSDLKILSSYLTQDLDLQPIRTKDYLYHDWQLNELTQTYQYLKYFQQKSRKEVDHRLNYALWRNWSRNLFDLKTISPEFIQWNKDCDITWLYGPYFFNLQSTPSPNVYQHCYSTQDDLHSTRRLKSALKRKSLASQFYHSALDSFSTSTIWLDKKDQSTSKLSETTLIDDEDKKIRFNIQVEQCVAVEDDRCDTEEVPHYQLDDDDDPFIIPPPPPPKQSILIKRLSPTSLNDQPPLDSHLNTSVPVSIHSLSLPIRPPALSQPSPSKFQQFFRHIKDLCRWCSNLFC